MARRGTPGSGGSRRSVDPGSDAPSEPPSGSIEPIEIQEEMERSFLEYSMSVIMQRALPDVRDGLKPVHRRILYSMDNQNLRPDRPHTKCAKVVGEVMGSYHPHGDLAIYDALVRMVQDFSLRLPLIDGHGNFGGTGPDEGPAAMRFSTAPLSGWRVCKNSCIFCGAIPASCTSSVPCGVEEKRRTWCRPIPSR